MAFYKVIFNPLYINNFYPPLGRAGDIITDAVDVYKRQHSRLKAYQTAQGRLLQQVFTVTVGVATVMIVMNAAKMLMF